MKVLSSKYLSIFCMELGLLLRTGLTDIDSLAMLRDKDDGKDSKAMIDYLCKSCEKGLTLSQSMEASGMFPSYMLGIVRLGELSNKLDEALSSLSNYYNDRTKLSAGLRSAIFYPILMLMIMATVVIILLTQVLPVFNMIFVQTGSEMSDFEVMLVRFGKGLSSASVVIIMVFSVFLIGTVLIYKVPSVRKVVFGRIAYSFGNKSIWGRISAAEFASAMSMAVSSGLDSEQAILIAGDICRSSPGMCKKMADCKEYLCTGESLDYCLSKARIFSKNESKALALGEKSEASGYLAEAANRSKTKIIQDLDLKLRKFEPTFVLISSLIVGLLLLSIMLPLLGIMSSIS